MAKDDIKSKFLLIRVSQDKMEAKLTVQPFTHEGVNITIHDVLEIINNKKISFGIKEQVIKETLEKVRNDNIPAEDVLIVQGIQPVNGEDGKVKFLFKADKKAKPVAIDKDSNHLDFHNISVIEDVAKDQPLAQLIAPTRGTPGKDVFGQSIEVQAGKECALPAGKETKISDRDKNTLVSCINGNVKYDGRVISVSSDYKVEKDVDFSVGNISYKGAVSIKGDVKSGFNISAGGNIEIGGIVNDATIKSEGDIKIAGGFVGSGKGKIEARGDVTIGFARNQMIIGNNIIFSREAIDCVVYARETIVAKGGRLSIVGGMLTAGSLIEVDVLGSEIEIPTEVEVGINYAASKGLMSVKKELNFMKCTLEKIDNEINTLKNLKEAKGILDQKHQEAFNAFLKQKEKLEEELKDLTQREKIASKRLEVNKDAKVIVHHTCFPGVTIKIGEATAAVREEYRNTTFYLDGNVIKKT